MNFTEELKDLINSTKEIGTEAKKQLSAMSNRMDLLEQKHAKAPVAGNDRIKETAYLTKGMKVAKEVAPSSLGEIISGVVTGKEFAAKSLTTSVPGGGYLLAPTIAGEIIDEARALTVADKVGCRWYPFVGSSVRFPRITGSPTGEWKEELAEASYENVTIDGINVTPKTLMAITKVSRELLEDSNLTQEVVSTALFNSLARQLDSAVLRGNATYGPTGIRFTNGIQTKSLNAALDRDELSIAVEKLALENFSANGVVMNPRDYHAMARLVSSVDEQPLQGFKDYVNLPMYATTAVPANLATGSPATNTGSEVYVADWSQCVVGVRQEFSLEINPNGAGFREHGVEIKLVGRFAVALLQPKAFYVMTDVTAS